MRYILSYGAHNFELFAFRGWLFAYLIPQAIMGFSCQQNGFRSDLSHGVYWHGCLCLRRKLCLSHGRAR